MPPPDRADAGNQAKPVYEQDENENRREKPKRFADEIPADDSFQEIVETLHQPFPKILRSARDRLNPAGGDLGEDNDAERDNPGHQHWVGDCEFANLDQGQRFEGNSVVFGRFRRESRRRQQRAGSQSQDRYQNITRAHFICRQGHRHPARDLPRSEIEQWILTTVTKPVFGWMTRDFRRIFRPDHQALWPDAKSLQPAPQFLL